MSQVFYCRLSTRSFARSPETLRFDEPNLGAQIDAETILDPLLHLVGEGENIFGGGVSPIYNDIGVALEHSTIGSRQYGSFRIWCQL